MDILQEASGIAKYHTRSGSRIRLPDCPEVGRKIHCVRGQMTQVFLNLMLNALDAAGPQGKVELSMACAEDQVRIQVRDDGPGVDPELFDRLFQPFVTSKKDGTGLGLYLSLKVVQAHGGTLVCRAPVVPRGGRFLRWRYRWVAGFPRKPAQVVSGWLRIWGVIFSHDQGPRKGNA